MAKLNGILKIEGTLQDMTFYKSQDGHLVRTKGGVSGQRIANDPAFARTRENGAEFGSSATAGKLLRDTVRNLIGSASDNRVTARITQLMAQVKNLDDTSARGERSVAVGIAKPEAKALVRGFNFNANSLLGAILYKPYTASTTTGVITLADFVPANDLKIVSGATHVSFQAAMAIIDFAAGTSAIEFTNEEVLAIDAASSTVTLTPAAVPTGTGTKMLFLTIEYFQEVNGFQYSLNNGAYNALAIIDVA
jgi:hypothetical protein